MRDIDQVRNCIQIIVDYSKCFGYAEYGDRGNACCGTHDQYLASLSTQDRQEEIEKEAYTMASVRIAMPKWSGLHLALSEKVKKQIPVDRINYDYLVKIVTRILCCVETSSELLTIAQKAALQRVIDGFDEPTAASAVTVTSFI